MNSYFARANFARTESRNETRATFITLIDIYANVNSKKIVFYITL